MLRFLIAALLTQLFLVSPGQNDSLRVEVVSVSSKRLHVYRPSDLETPFSAARPNITNSTNPGPRGLPNTSETQIEQRTSIDQRSREMSNVEAKANRDRATGTPRQLYAYEIKPRNTGTATIKFIIWDYETIDPAGGAASPVHTFSCSTKIKPNSTAVLKVTTHSPPDRVISAKSGGKVADQRGIIDRVEYDDGSVWQRPGWNLADSTPTSKAKTSRCREIH